MFAAALTGAGLVSIPFIIFGPLALLAFLIAVIPWIAGVWVLGAPLWLLLSRVGIGSRWAAMVLGAALSSVAMYVASGQEFGVPLSVALGLAGGLAGYIGWGVAYRPDAPIPDSDVDEVFG
jgi:hypothetical protein